MAKKPGLADVQCTRLQFRPGDRILVRHFGKLDYGQQRKLRKTIQKWAGVELEVLIIDTSRMDIQIEQNTPNPKIVDGGKG